MTETLWLECVGGPLDGERFPVSTPPRGYEAGWVRYCRTSRRSATLVRTWTREWALREEQDDADD